MNDDPAAARKKKRNEYYRGIKLRLFAIYGGECECCGETSPEFLVIDHRYGNGRKHREREQPTVLFLRLLREGVKNPIYRLLCHNCNQSRGAFGYCPHEKLDRAASRV